jgi:hypothetical protein
LALPADPGPRPEWDLRLLARAASSCGPPLARFSDAQPSGSKTEDRKTVIYREVSLFQGHDGQWRWYDPASGAHSQRELLTLETARRDVDRQLAGSANVLQSYQRRVNFRDAFRG